MFLIIAASQLSLPAVFGTPYPEVAAVFSPDDMPAYVQINGITQFVLTRTTIAPNGTTQDCVAERSSGDPKLDALTCSIILRRAKFRPAKWIDGSPAYSIARGPITWAIGSPPSEREHRKAFPPDLELKVDQLPKGVGRKAGIALMIAVDENGTIVECGDVPPIFRGPPAKFFPELTALACRKAVSDLRPVVARDPSGKPVRSVQRASVLFTVGN